MGEAKFERYNPSANNTDNIMVRDKIIDTCLSQEIVPIFIVIQLISRPWRRQIEQQTLLLKIK